MAGLFSCQYLILNHMKFFLKNISVLLLTVLLTACNYFTYTPRSKKNVQREKPSIVLLNSIIDYRLEQNAWPFSREEFISKRKKYKEAFDGFPYQRTIFKRIDNNKMIFYFSEHIKDVQNY